MPKVQKDQNNISMCVCTKGCPSYNDCAKKANQVLFCSVGKTNCNFKKNGCNCGSCQVFKKYNLKTGYYCINGAEDNGEQKLQK